MTVLVMTLLIGIGAFAAGLLGSLTGLGGGIIVVPLLTLAFGVDIRYAIGASLVSVIATSSGAAAAYVKEGYTNIRIGMLLEVATTIGALIGVWVAVLVSANVIEIIFACILLFTAVQSMRPQAEHLSERSSPLAARLRLASTYPTSTGLQHYEVRGVPLGFALMFLAGALSALLGIGSGVVKVLAMDRAMHLPFKVSTTTSNFMIGVTAAASAGVYLNRGYIDPALALPVTLGVLAGALVGARILTQARTRVLRTLFTVVMVVIAGWMFYKGIAGGSLMEPPVESSRWTDKQVEQLVGNLLRIGVMLAATVTTIGGIVFLMQHGMTAADYHLFTSEPTGLRSLSAIVSGALRFDSRSVVQLGVVLLIATPIARVMLTLVAFILQKDRLYTGITAVVLLVLLYSLFLSGR